MSAETTTPTVEDVLRAVGRGCLYHLCPSEEARPLAAVVSRVEAGIELSLEDQRSAARLLQAAREYLAGPLESMGLTIPAPPEPVHRSDTTSTGATSAKLWLRADGTIGILAPFAMRETVAGLPGARRDRQWNKGQGCWTVPQSPASAAAALEALTVCGYQARPGVLALADAHLMGAAARDVLLDGAPLPDGDGTDVVTMPLWSHQLRAVTWAESAQAGVWAIKMGGGKTGAAIAAANRVQARTVLIVAPNRVRAVWPREVRERSAVNWHIEDGTRPSKVRGGRRQDLLHPERRERLNRVLWDCDCGAPVHAFVLNYEALTQRTWQEWTPPERIDLIIYDEAHRLKAYQTKTPKRKIKGPAEKALRPGATDDEILAARRDDAIGPRERALSADAPRKEVTLARRLDKAEHKAEEQARANKLTVSGVAARWVQWSHRRIALTGTPFPQHPWDIFGLYRAIDPGVFGAVWTPFRDKYLQMDRSGTFPVKVHPLMMREFADAALSLMYRPKVDLKLPGCTDVQRVVELEDDARKAYDQLDAQLWTDLSRWLRPGAPTEGADPEPIETAQFLDDELGAPQQLTARNILSRLLRLQQLTGGTLRTDPVELPDGRIVPGPEARVSRVKADELADVLDEVGCVAPAKDSTTTPEPVIVFCRFTSDLDAVAEVAAKAKLRYAEISGRRSDGLNDDARMTEHADVVGVQIQAGGTGVDLTRAAYAVWYSLGYSVSDYDQARARLYRPGQTRPVVYIHLVAKDTQDMAVYQAIKARRDAVSAVLLAGGVDPAEVGVAEEFITADPTADRVAGVDDGAAAVALPWEK